MTQSWNRNRNWFAGEKWAAADEMTRDIGLKKGLEFLILEKNNIIRNMKFYETGFNS